MILPHGPGGPTYEELRARYLANKLGVSYRRVLKIVREWNEMTRAEKKAYSNSVDDKGTEDIEKGVASRDSDIGHCTFAATPL